MFKIICLPLVTLTILAEYLVLFGNIQKVAYWSSGYTGVVVIQE